MHIRQPYVCENGEPAIVCINQIISDSEAPHFKMQSQLYSSHIARSPEFLSQGGSPPHTITQVALERETINMPYGGMGNQRGSERTYNQGEFGITLQHAPLVGDSGSGHGGDGIRKSPEGRPSYCENGSDCSSSPNSQTSREGKPMGRAHILNQLKRKIEMSSQQQCKPAKMPKCKNIDSSDQGSNSGGITIQGSAFITGPSYFDSSMGGNMSHFNSGSGEVMAPISQGPVFAELGLKNVVKMEVPPPNSVTLSMLTDFHQPLTPPTPPSSVTSEPTDTTTNLTIDIAMCDTVNVPPSMLTPESPPSHSPILKDAQLEQCVPGFRDIQDVLTDIEVESLDDSTSEYKQKEKTIKMQVKPTKKSDLPQLDILSLEDFLASVESKMPAPDAPNVEMYPVRKTDSPVMLPLQQMMNVASPASSEESCQMLDDNQLLPDEMNDMSDCQINLLVASVTQALLDMVQDSTAPTNVLGEFTIIPSGIASGTNMADTQLCGQPSPASSCGNPAEVPCMDLDQSSPIAGDLLHELHQLNQLAASTSSYGKHLCCLFNYSSGT